MTSLWIEAIDSKRLSIHAYFTTAKDFQALFFDFLEKQFYFTESYRFANPLLPELKREISFKATREFREGDV